MLKSKSRNICPENFRQLEIKDISVITFWKPGSITSHLQISMIQNVSSLFKKEVFFAFVDVEEQVSLKERFNIKEAPVIVIMKRGKTFIRLEGVQRGKFLAGLLTLILNTGEEATDFRKLWTSSDDPEMERRMHESEILVIDDDKKVKEHVKEILNEGGYQNVTMAGNYDETVRCMEEGNPKLIFLNVGMADKVGQKIMKALRQNEEWRKVPRLVTVGPGKHNLRHEISPSFLRERSIQQPRSRESLMSLVRYILLLDNIAELDRRTVVIESIVP